MSRSRLDIVRHLLQHGADASLGTDAGWQPLHTAGTFTMKCGLNNFSENAAWQETLRPSIQIQQSAEI